MSSTTSKVLPNGEHHLIRDGVIVGQSWRWPVGSNGKRKVGFGVVLNGWYWRNDEPSQHGGSSATGVRTLREARELADKVLGNEGGQK